MEIHLLERAAQDDELVDEAIADMRAAEREGLFIARRIRAMMAERPDLRYRDFAILTRQKSSVFSQMLPQLLAEGVPAYADGAAGYFDAPEVALALAMLRLVANRRGDVDLIAVLHSPVAGLDAEALAQIRIAARRVPFVDAAWKCAYGETLAERSRPRSAPAPGSRRRPRRPEIRAGRRRGASRKRRAGWCCRAAGRGRNCCRPPARRGRSCCRPPAGRGGSCRWASRRAGRRRGASRKRGGRPFWRARRAAAA